MNFYNNPKFQKTMYFKDLVEDLSSDGKLKNLNDFFQIKIDLEKDEIIMTRKKEKTKYTDITEIEITCTRGDFDTEYGLISIRFETDDDTEGRFVYDNDPGPGETMRDLSANLAKGI
jgi:hypothetical protein